MLERLNQLEINVAELEKFKSRYSIEDIENDIQKEWILRYGLLESIQIVIDISCHLSNKFNLGNPQTYSECIELLVKNDFFDRELGDKLKGMVGLRNILIHEYVSVNIGRLYSLLDYVNDFVRFAAKVKDVI